MFTGIIEKTALVYRAETLNSGALLFTINTGFTDLQVGESVAIDGVCLTVAELTREGAQFFLSTETLQCTRFGSVNSKNTLVNLERALPIGARLSGHWVQGHVDGLAKLLATEQVDQSRKLQFELPAHLARYCIQKGSITLNGVSLTLNEVVENKVSVNIIPHTWQATNLKTLEIGQSANVEVDLLAKYTEKLCQNYYARSNT